MFKIKIKNTRIEGSNETISRMERMEEVTFISAEKYTEKELLHAIKQLKLDSFKSVFDETIVRLYSDTSLICSIAIKSNHTNIVGIIVLINHHTVITNTLNTQQAVYDLLYGNMLAEIAVNEEGKSLL